MEVVEIGFGDYKPEGVGGGEAKIK